MNAEPLNYRTTDGSQRNTTQHGLKSLRRLMAALKLSGIALTTVSGSVIEWLLL
jgi:hypothetical protein